MNALTLWQESLLHLTVKGTFLLTMALLVGMALRRLSAARRYWLWLSTILALLMITLALPLLPAWRVLPPQTWEPGLMMPNEENLSVTLPALPSRPTASAPKNPVRPAVEIRSSAAATPIEEKTAAIQPIRRSLSVGEWFSLAWLGGCLLMLTRLGLCTWRLRRLERSTVPVSADLQARLPVVPAELAHRMRLAVMPHILLGHSGSVPMVWGLWKPRLLLPEGFHLWPADKLRAVLLHEFEHLRRRDPLALAAAQMMHALHWFNPLAWLTLRHLRAEQEHACDDAALAQGIRPSDYAQHLLDLSRHTRQAPGLGLCALAMTRPAPVESRVHAILDPCRPRQASSRNVRRLFLGLALATALPLAMLHSLEPAPVRGRILDRHGVVLAISQEPMERLYLLNETASHLLGYTRKSESEPALTSSPAQFGSAGVEKTYDTQLSTGQDITLTLDHRIQKIAHQALTEAGATRGAVVVMDPCNGDVLAMVSLPVYDPQDLFPSLTKETWAKLLSDGDLPLLNRTTRPFIPGSAFSLSVALAGGLGGIQDRQFKCTGSVTYGNKAMTCWLRRDKGGSHGALSLKHGIKSSCECFFYQYGNAVGIDNITKMGKLLGLGELTGIELDEEEEGILPNPEWLLKHQPKKRWSLGHTATASIGQGFVASTPLQLAVLAATIANGGQVPKPRLIDDGSAPTWRADLRKEGISFQHMETIRQALLENVNDLGGSAQLAHSKDHLIAGLTATAQSWRRVNDQKIIDNHGWFIGFAPYDKPSLAFAVMIEGANSGAECAPVARQIVEQALAVEKADQESLKRLSPADLAAMGELRPFKADPRTVPQQGSYELHLLEAKEKIRQYQLKKWQLEKGFPVLPPAKTKDGFKGSKPRGWNGDWNTKPVPVA